MLHLGRCNVYQLIQIQFDPSYALLTEKCYTILMDTTILIGYIAGILTTISFIPQVVRNWKLRETRDISLAMLLLLTAGILLWILYGLRIGSPPIIAANTITFVLILFLLWMKMKFK